LEQEHISYEIYQEPKSLFADYGKVIKEAQELENAEQEDTVNEE
jgi:hypothetical protein